MSFFDLMPEFTFDLSRWPLVVATAPAQLNLEIAEAGVERLRSTLGLHLHMKVGVLLDSRARVGLPDPILRRNWSRLLKSIEPDIQRSVAAWAVVTSSPLLRAAYTAILWLAPAPCPAAFFTDMGDAERWIRARLSTSARRVA